MYLRGKVEAVNGTGEVTGLEPSEGYPEEVLN